MLLLLIESLYSENSPNSNVGCMESLLKSSFSDVDELSTWKLRQKLTNMEPKFLTIIFTSLSSNLIYQTPLHTPVSVPQWVLKTQWGGT